MTMTMTVTVTATVTAQNCGIEESNLQTIHFVGLQAFSSVRMSSPMFSSDDIYNDTNAVDFTTHSSVGLHDDEHEPLAPPTFPEVDIILYIGMALGIPANLMTLGILLSSVKLR